MCNWRKFIRRFLIFMVIIFGVLTIIASGGDDDDDGININESNDEDNGSEESEIDFTGTWIGTFITGENDCGFTEGQEGKNVILLDQNGSTITNLLWDVSGEVVGNSFTISTGPPVNLTLTGSGSSNNISGTYEYTMPIDEGCSGTDTYTAVKTDDWFDTATQITLPYSSSSESIETYPDVNFYEFTTSEAGDIVVSVTGDDPILICYLYDSSLNILSSLPAAMGPIIYTSESVGTFYVVVIGHTVTNYEMIVSLAEPNADGNDTFETATLITLPYTSTEASIDTVTDVDYYTFTTTGAGTISVTLTGLTSYIDLYLYDSSQNEIDYYWNYGEESESIEYASGSAGTFYIMVDGWQGSISDYTLTVSLIEPNADGNDTFETATPITLPYTSTGVSIDTATDMDYYTFMTTGAGTISVDLTDLSDDLDLELYDDSQVLLDGSYNSGTDSESIEYISGSAGTFYVMVDGWQGSISDYTLTVTLE